MQHSTSSTHQDDPLNRTNLERLLTADEVAQILNVSKSFAYQLMQRGEIPTLRLGRAVRCRRQDLFEWVDSQVCRTSTSRNGGCAK
jgi:excisionase family DNA binding protein